MLFSVFMLAVKSVYRNLLRSFLTILGIVIGVSAVITMVTIGNGATQAIKDQISSLGTNILLLSPGQRIGGNAGGGGGVPQFTEADADAIRDQIGGIKFSVATSQRPVVAIANGHNWSTVIAGAANDYFAAGNWALASGRSFEPAEEEAGAAVCVIGETVRREVFGGTMGQTGLGSALRIKQFSCQVIGITKPKGQIGMGDQDNSIVTPLKTFLRRVSGNSHIGLIVIAMNEDVDSTSLKASLTQLMRERRKLGDLKTGGTDDNFNIFDTQQLADTLSGTMGLLTSLLGAVAAVSLLVGGIGIMNIMLVSVTERTREIGLRLAVGALEGEVLLQFLIEAVVLSALGGLIGIFLATAASIGLSSLMNLPYRFDAGINTFALFFSGLIGVIFGYFPARGAARMDPIEALRHE
jgi:putative ABC transport system permease protein